MKNSSTARMLQSKSKRFPRYIEQSVQELQEWSENDYNGFLAWVNETKWNERPVNRGDDLAKAGFVRQWYAKHIDKVDKEKKSVDLQFKMPFL